MLFRSIRAENRREATFSWLDGWTQLVDEKTERSRGMTLELSSWFWEGVMMKGGVLSIDRAYFAITGGRERWLYRVARKHAGGAGEGGFAISMPVLFEKSGAEGQYRRFKFELLKLAEKNALPGYDLSVEQPKEGEPLLRMVRVDGKGGAGRLPLAHEGEEGAGDTAGHQGPTPADRLDLQFPEGSSAPVVSPGKRSAAEYRTAQQEPSETSPPDAAPRRPARAAPLQADASGDPGEHAELVDAARLIRSTVAGLSDKATRGVITEETAAHLRQTCPGWDLYTLHAEFERWISGDPERTPANWQNAFIGWVKRHHARHAHELRR